MFRPICPSSSVNILMVWKLLWSFCLVSCAFSSMCWCIPWWWAFVPVGCLCVTMIVIWVMTPCIVADKYQHFYEHTAFIFMIKFDKVRTVVDYIIWAVELTGSWHVSSISVPCLAKKQAVLFTLAHKAKAIQFHFKIRLYLTSPSS
jgi:hypothetical protein